MKMQMFSGPVRPSRAAAGGRPSKAPPGGPGLGAWLVAGCLAAGLTAGCGGGGVADAGFSSVGASSTDGQLPLVGTIELQHNLLNRAAVAASKAGPGAARAVPAEVTTFRIFGFDAMGEVIFGPQDVAKAASITLTGVPVAVTRIQIEYLAGDEVLYSFIEDVALVAGGSVLISDPALGEAVQVRVTGRQEASVDATWMAYQDGPEGEWRRLYPVADGLYVFPVTDPGGRFAAAGVGEVPEGGSGNTSTTVKVHHATLAETRALEMKLELPTGTGMGSGGHGGGGGHSPAWTPLQEGTSPGGTLSGGVSGLGGMESGRLFLDRGLFADLSDGAQGYSLQGLLPGRHPLIALKGPGYLLNGAMGEGTPPGPSDNRAINRILLDAIQVPHSQSGEPPSFTYDLDFSGPRAVDPVDGRITMDLRPGFDEDSLEAMVYLATIRETRVPVGFMEPGPMKASLNGALPAVSYRGYPFLPAEDHELAPAAHDDLGLEGLHLFQAQASGAEDMAQGTPLRTISRYFLLPQDLEEAFLGTGLGPVTVSSSQASWPAYGGEGEEAAGAYGAEIEGEVEGSSVRWRMSWSLGWLGQQPEYTVSLPSFTPQEHDWDFSWSFGEGSRWRVHAAVGQGYTLPALLDAGGHGADGLRLRTAARQGVLSPPLP